ncbi:hypothetical protein TNCV_4279241 [Trichonephila clavipes]|nr:hypothetical protein TNCV_4279241 [Trichonephila clavipes]
MNCWDTIHHCVTLWQDLLKEDQICPNFQRTGQNVRPNEVPYPNPVSRTGGFRDGLIKPSLEERAHLQLSSPHHYPVSFWVKKRRIAPTERQSKVCRTEGTQRQMAIVLKPFSFGMGESSWWVGSCFHL